jgi:FAD:protein FMN transferase
VAFRLHFINCGLWIADLNSGPTQHVTRRALLGFEPRREERAPASGHWIRVFRRAMACRFEVTLAGDRAVNVPVARAALTEADRLEDLLSIFRAGSELSRLNQWGAVGPVPLGEELFAILQLCQELSADCGGAFDVTSTPLSACWGFLRREPVVPPPAAVDAARLLVGSNRVTLDAAARTVAFERPGVSLNLGAIGKGYALDRASLGLRISGVAHALLSAGRSSLLAMGGRGEGWLIDLVSPLLAGGAIAGFWLRNAAVGTSGVGEQFVIADGHRYGHVIDPRTGWPANGVVSASVIASDAASADALSTAFLIGGIDLARRYCAEHRDVLALITPDDRSERPIVIGGHPGVRFVTQ